MSSVSDDETFTWDDEVTGSVAWAPDTLLFEPAEALILGDVGEPGDEFEDFAGSISTQSGLSPFQVYARASTLHFPPHAIPIALSAAPVDAEGLNPYELYLLELMDGQTTIEELGEEGPLAPDELRLSLLTLLDRGLIALDFSGNAEPTEERRIEVQPIGETSEPKSEEEPTLVGTSPLTDPGALGEDEFDAAPTLFEGRDAFEPVITAPDRAPTVPRSSIREPSLAPSMLEALSGAVSEYVSSSADFDDLSSTEIPESVPVVSPPSPRPTRIRVRSEKGEFEVETISIQPEGVFARGGESLAYRSKVELAFLLDDRPLVVPAEVVSSSLAGLGFELSPTLPLAARAVLSHWSKDRTVTPEQLDEAIDELQQYSPAPIEPKAVAVRVRVDPGPAPKAAPRPKTRARSERKRSGVHSHQKGLELYQRAKEELARGRVVEARMNAKLALAHDPQNAQFRGLFQSLMAGPPESRKVRRRPESMAADLFDRAITAEKNGDPDGAIKLLENALRQQAAPNIMNRLGVLLAVKSRDIARAQELLERAVKLAPDNPVYTHNLGKVLTMAASESQPRGKKKPQSLWKKLIG